MEPRDPNFAARVQQSFDKQKFMEHLGAKISDIVPGSVKISMPFQEMITQQHGYIHAGAVASIADSACGYAALTLMPKEAGVLTVEYKINLVAPAVGERFYTVGVVKKPGRTLSLCNADVIAISGTTEKIVASLVATIMTLENRGITD